jgi:thiosulfate reductase cytochrome b subunit
MVCGLWFVVCGLWFVVCGLWFVVCGLSIEHARKPFIFPADINTACL